MQTSSGFLVLEDGKIFKGRTIGAWRDAIGEVVFNTSMTGYQEILSDPSSAGQIVVLTYPLVGNYGISSDFAESNSIHVAGLVVAEDCSVPSHWKSTSTLGSHLLQHNVPGLADVDTRALTRHLRNQGVMRGFLTREMSDTTTIQELFAEHQPSAHITESVGASKVYSPKATGSWRVAVVDFGVKANIINSLIALDASVWIYPSTTTAEEILSCSPDAVLLSNGPGNPKDCVSAIAETKKLIKSVPLMGICLGHQVLALATGGDTYKLKSGHRGGNHPVKDLATGSVFMTSQNHGYAVADNPSADFQVTHTNVNDGSIEGITHRELPVFSVQFHPEASLGSFAAPHLFTKLQGMAQKQGGLAHA